jgi:hypothetical protein
MIDEHARICPFCGANTATGARIDIRPFLEEQFPRKPRLDSASSVIEYLRRQQGITIALITIAALAILFGINRWMQAQNARAAASSPAIPLTEIVDVGTRDTEQAPPLPEPQFQFDGNPSTLKTFIVEPGAVAPPEAATQTAAAGAAQQQPAASAAGTSHQPVPATARPQLK